jgi:hypothetical protein
MHQRVCGRDTSPATSTASTPCMCLHISMT